ncbi:NADH-ubiquinone oxidoreductase-F iron-sulfur binding region domain-containing protein [Patulibacter sp. NPDC049589]|uniref:NADH-ubiquinone oxidoreductase-F iron-sulfur binding region domain-containing protein n=1 Tax=Patulibacter sp. NPDC049589 TaxID=3154731 RepID=UPI003433661E
MIDRLLSATVPHGAVPLRDHDAVHGPLPGVGARDLDALVGTLGAAGLRGRGGAGFPASRKLAAVAANAGRRARPVVVVNGTEGEPASGKDRLLLHTQPHLVLDGAVLVARALGATEIHVVAPAGTLPGLGAAVRERDGRREPAVRLLAAARGYVAGEETAVLAHLEGRPARPRVTPPRPGERGRDGRPTLLQNVETLAHVALIARHGHDWFRHHGTAERPGTTLVTLSGALAAGGVREVAVGTPIPALVAAAGHPTEPLRALLIGGYFGAWIDARDAPALTDTALRPLGASVGAGVVIALGASECPVRRVATLGAWMAGQSAGQCGPCVSGLDAIAGALHAFAVGTAGARELALLDRWTAMVDGRGACAHPTGTARMIHSATVLFAEELYDHAHHGSCRACATGAPAGRTRRTVPA